MGVLISRVQRELREDDEVDEIGQIGGMNPGLGNDWRHKPFYLSLVAYLRARGF